MESAAEILMSTRELGCRRANSQSQRYLSRVISQYDLEKQLVERDWNNRMKALVKQKQKFMPKDWDPKRAQRAKTSLAGSTRKSSYHIHSRVDDDEVAPTIPEHWKLLASYHVSPNGERILKTLPGEIPVNMQAQRASARILSQPRKYPLRHRRILSAPASRTECLVTQLNSKSKELSLNILETTKEFENTLERKEGSNGIEHEDIKQPEIQKEQIKSSALSSKKPPMLKCRPMSAGRTMTLNKRYFKQRKTVSSKPNSKSYHNTEEGNLSEQEPSYTLIKQVVELEL